MRAPPAVIVGIFLLLAMGGLWWYTDQQEEHYQDRIEPWVRTTLSDISRWEPDTLLRHLSPAARMTLENPQQLDTVLARYRPLGELRGIEDIQLARVPTAMALLSGDRKRLSYQIRARFAAGVAPITCTILVAKDGSFSLYNFSIGKVDGP